MTAPAPVIAEASEVAEAPAEPQQEEKQAECNNCHTLLGPEDVKPDPLGAFDLDRFPVCRNIAECWDRMWGARQAKRAEAERARREAEERDASESPGPASPGPGNKPPARKRTRQRPQRQGARTVQPKAKPAPKEEAAS